MLNSWRDNREPGWYNDIGYKIQDALRKHLYQDWIRIEGKVGWHACKCGWEGYWCDFEPHVVDYLREVVVND